MDEKAAAVVRQIFQWKMEGMSGSRIADKLNALGIPTPLEYKHMNGENLQCGFQKKAGYCKTRRMELYDHWKEEKITKEDYRIRREKLMGQ